MPPNADVPLYILAFDHRSTLTRGLMGASGPLEGTAREWAVAAKGLVLDALLLAVARGVDRSAAAFLVDDEFGAEAARSARAAGIQLAVPAERSGEAELVLEHRDALEEMLDRLRPDFVKVLLRRNPDGPTDVRAREDDLLRSVGGWLRQRGTRLLLEVVVPATEPQLLSVGSSPDRFDLETRPGLMLRVIGDLQDAGIDPDIWKLEGLDVREDCERIVALTRRDGRDAVRCLVLGRAAEMERVLRWLTVAAGVEGYRGFAVGRTLWWDELSAFRSGTLDRATAVSRIAGNYANAVEVFERSHRGSADALGA